MFLGDSIDHVAKLRYELIRHLHTTLKDIYEEIMIAPSGVLKNSSIKQTIKTGMQIREKERVVIFPPLVYFL